MAIDKEYTFGLVHGAWHGAWCWEPLQAELENLGVSSIAMDLPIDDPAKNFNDYADVVIEHMSQEKNIVLVGHSRGGNVIPRAAKALAARKLIFLHSSFEPATIGHPVRHEVGFMPERNNPVFQKAIIRKDHGLTIFDQRYAPQLFYNDCTPGIQEWATSKLRPQRRSEDEPTLYDWPAEIQQEYIIAEDDQIINPKWSQYVAENWLTIDPVYIEGGHSSFLSRPRKLARLLIELAE